ncbi:MAG: cytidine deaminase [Acetobacter sp.]|nr:cytidine deaminase [Acetobacter sp.]
MEIKKQLWEKAKIVRLNAYTPYSNYKVGAAICAESGKIYASCNVENLSFPCGTCAEAGAIATMIAGGDKKIKAILIISEGNELVYPCGACLQRIAEFADDETLVYLADITAIRKTYHIKDLLPHNFKASELKND